MKIITKGVRFPYYKVLIWWSKELIKLGFDLVVNGLKVNDFPLDSISYSWRGMCELRMRIEWGYRRQGWCRTSLSRATGCKPNRQNESYDKALSWMKSQQPWSVVVNYDVRDTFFVNFLLLDPTEPKVTRVDPSGASAISRGSICNCWHLEVWLAGALFLERMYHPWNNTNTDVAFKGGSFVYIWVEVQIK